MGTDAENEYKKCPELKKDEVLKLMDWCKRQPHLPNLNGIYLFHTLLI